MDNLFSLRLVVKTLPESLKPWKPQQLSWPRTNLTQMKWRTEVEVVKGSRPIGYKDQVLVFGSCFANHLGAKLDYYQFRYLANPFGVLFHPVPMERLLRRAAERNQFSEGDIFEHEKLWRSLEAHSRLAQNSQQSTLDGMNQALATLRDSLSKTSHIVFTLGTAFAFRHHRTNSLVANCHKMPQQEFRRELTPVAELIQSLESMVALVKAINSACHILFTVSPVRHIRDGLVENQRSKAHLLTAVHEVVDTKRIHYFPAYELLMDDLRDYRFYNRDLIHPSEQAVDYVWEKFMESWIDPEAVLIMQRVASIRKQLAHRVLNPDSEQGIDIGDRLRQKANELKKEYPFIHFDL